MSIAHYSAGNNEVSPFGATKYVAVVNTTRTTRDKRRGASRRRNQTHRNSARWKVLADAMSKDHVRSLRSRVFNDLRRAREYAARCNALNGVDALSIPSSYNSRSSVVYSLFSTCYTSAHAASRTFE